jgi:RNA polymerase sigma-70 factor (ECF subfamily)
MKQPLNMSAAARLLGDAILPAEQRAAEPDHGEMVRAARAGDESAFEGLYLHYGRMVHGILLARVPYAHVDDLVQDVFVAAWRRLATLRDESAFAGWLAMIARNRAIDYHRQRVETVELLEDSATAPREAPEASLDATRALRAIRELPDAYRETLVLRLVEGLSGPEIAQRTGLTPASVRVNLHRGMKLLREKLGLEQ